MLTGYFDDSGKPGDCTIVTLSGFVATVDQWLRFEDDWKAVLSLPQFSLPYFHMKEVRQATEPPFDRFNRNHALRQDLFDRMLCLIRARVEISFSGAVVVEDYNAVNRDFKVLETLGPPQHLAAALATGKLIGWRNDRRPSVPLKIVCDQGMDHFGMLSDQMYEAHGIRPLPAVVKDAPGLQAADFVAWEIQRALTDTLNRNITYWHELRSNMLRLIGTSALKWFVVDHGELLKLVEKVPIPPREASAREGR